VTAAPRPSFWAGLSAAEWREVQDVTDYIAAHTRDGTRPAEGSMIEVVNRASPRVRERLAEAYRVLEDAEAGVRRPFGEVPDLHHTAARLEMNPSGAARVYGVIQTEDVTARLQERMGTDADRPDPDLTRRDFVEAALDMHTGDDRE
jgi:hypothetical protein